MGHVFPEKLPDWAGSNFWAPEFYHENGRTYMYYTARSKQGGMLCVAVASADHPAGPYPDHGPLVGQEAGSIDGFAMPDEHGDLYLIWKEDGNSCHQDTPIWAQRLNAERTALIGEATELFGNDATLGRPAGGRLGPGAAQRLVLHVLCRQQLLRQGLQLRHRRGPLAQPAGPLGEAPAKPHPRPQHTCGNAPATAP